MTKTQRVNKIKSNEIMKSLIDEIDNSENPETFIYQIFCQCGQLQDEHNKVVAPAVRE